MGRLVINLLLFNMRQAEAPSEVSEVHTSPASILMASVLASMTINVRHSHFQTSPAVFYLSGMGFHHIKSIDFKGGMAAANCSAIGYFTLTRSEYSYKNLECSH